MVHADPNAHAGHAHAAGDLIAQAERLCAERRLQLTPLRRRVFEALAGSEAPLGAYDLVERLGVERRVAPISVYRALDFLIEAGLIHRIATQNSYLPCQHSHDTHEATLFLVCKTCGHVDEVSSPDVARGINGTAAAAGFRTGHQPVEIAGECQTCQGGGRAPG
jgi:Fur family zinc uptake transcriptional regulator